MQDDQTTIDDLKRLVQHFVAERDWQRFHSPKNLAMSIAIEAAELMEHFQWTGPDSPLASPDAAEQVADEMADVFAYLLALANVSGIDLAAATEAKMKQNRAKYPVEEYRGTYQRPER